MIGLLDYLTFDIQVQCQLFCTSKTYCDFVLWTSEDVHIERIYPDEELWLAGVEKAQMFFQTAVLPELIGKWYSRPPKVPVATQPNTSAKQSDSSPTTTVTAPELYC